MKLVNTLVLAGAICALPLSASAAVTFKFQADCLARTFVPVAGFVDDYRCPGPITGRVELPDDYVFGTVVNYAPNQWPNAPVLFIDPDSNGLGAMVLPFMLGQGQVYFTEDGVGSYWFYTDMTHSTAGGPNGFSHNEDAGYHFIGGPVTAALVPEPPTLLMLAAALGLAGWTSRKR